MSNEWGEIMFRFDWPDGLASDVYQAGESVGLSLQWHEIVPPIPSVGEEVVFDDEQELPDEMARGNSRRRLLIGRVASREFAFTSSRYDRRVRIDWSVDLAMQDVREWSP